MNYLRAQTPTSSSSFRKEPRLWPRQASRAVEARLVLGYVLVTPEPLSQGSVTAVLHEADCAIATAKGLNAHGGRRSDPKRVTARRLRGSRLACARGSL